MNSETYQQINEVSSERLSEALQEFTPRMLRELVAEAVRVEMAEMEAAGKILKLTDEEIRLLRSFRRFKSTATKAGVVFKWQTRPLEDDVLVVNVGDLVHITDPQDMSGQ